MALKPLVAGAYVVRFAMIGVEALEAGNDYILVSQMFNQLAIGVVQIKLVVTISVGLIQELILIIR